MLRVEHLRVGDNAPISFEVKEGRCLAIKGPSGAGKTRLLRAIADLDETTGQVFVDGAERNEMSAPAWRTIVRYLAAEPGWWSDTPRPAFPSDPQSAPALQKLMRALNLDTELLDRTIAKLSTGERQRLALARTLITQPRVLALDEPTSSLDPTSAALAEELIRYQLLSGKIVLLISHDNAQIGRLADETLALVPARAQPSNDAATEQEHL